MELWFIHSLVALVALGCMQAFYKLPASKGYNPFLYSFLSYVCAMGLSLFFFQERITFDYEPMLFGFLCGTAYALNVLLQMRILKKLDTSASFPITSLSSHVLVVLLGVLFFKDVLSFYQMVGVGLTFFIVGFYNHTNKHITFSNGLIPIALGIVLLSTFGKFTQKFGSISTDIYNLIFWQFAFSTIISFLVLVLIKNNKKHERKADTKLVLWSIILGILNFIGTVEIVRALSVGPFSLVYTINSFYILVSSVVAWKLFGEKLTKQKIIFILLAIGVIIVIKLG
jgi:uncharacterized membrane protein